MTVRTVVRREAKAITGLAKLLQCSKNAAQQHHFSAMKIDFHSVKFEIAASRKNFSI